MERAGEKLPQILQMTKSIIRRAAMAAAGAFVQAATPLHSAALDPTVALDGNDFWLRPVAAAPAAEAPPVMAQDVPDHFEVSLDPGEFVWEPDRAVSGNVEIVVSVPLQLIYVYRGGTLIGVSTVSTVALTRTSTVSILPITSRCVASSLSRTPRTSALMSATSDRR